jgi:hypothetical protein
MPDMKSTPGGDPPVDPMEALKADLFAIYYAAGQSVRYVAESGEERAYWANRYLQALKRAVDIGDAEVLALIRRMVMSDEPSRGFGYIAAAGRLDLTVEAAVADPGKPYHHLFDEELVRAAEQRLAEHGYTVAAGSGGEPHGGLGGEAIAETPDGFSVEVTVEVGRDGAVTVTSGEVTERVNGVLGAVSTFTGLLAQAHAAATGAAGSE